MEYRTLGQTGIKVSLICLGTMTWGQQNTREDAFEQMDYAVDQGVNFFDTAELYAIPPTADTQGLTEQYVGDWFQKSGKRKDIVLASKVMGPSQGVTWVRGEETPLSPEDITRAIEGSLKRLQTDYLDLYQVHWPRRPVNMFRVRGFQEQQVSGREEDQILETLQALNNLVTSGKVRAIGLSNETPWGLTTYLKLARENNLPRVVSVQNPYNLLDRIYEHGLAEISMQEKAGLLAYSPLAAGSLSGKYLDGDYPAGSRWTIDRHVSRYDKPNGHRATARYVDIARKHGLDPCQMALAFINSRAFITANIIGATSMAHLKTNIGSIDVKLSHEVLQDIDEVHQDIPDPCP